MFPHQKHEIHFSIANIGQIKFEWFWVMKIEKIASCFDFSVDKSEEIIEAGQTSKTKLVLMPLIECQIKPHKICIKVNTCR